MVKAQCETYEKQSGRIGVDHQVKVQTVPCVLGAPPPVEYVRLRVLPLEERNKRKSLLDWVVKEEVPYGLYPCNMTIKGLSS